MPKKKQTTKMKNEKTSEAAKKSSESCNDKNCHIHGHLRTRGRTFEGIVTRKFDKRITIEFERMVYVRKYERYTKSKTKLHARLTSCMRRDINVGDRVRIQKCRPLSKIIHFVVIEKISEGNLDEGGKK